MHIQVCAGIGEGPTPLAAFDAALVNAGVANYNLLGLSSIIPPETTIDRSLFVAPAEEYGRRLYVVMARRQATERGEEAWAGLGWAQEPSDGRGLFVECHGSGEHTVCQEIKTTLTAMMAGRDRSYGPIDCEVVGTRCTGRPVCALVVAVYRSAAWE